MGILKLAIKVLGVCAVATAFGIEGMYLGYGVAAKEDERLKWLSKDSFRGKQILDNRSTAAKHLDELRDLKFVPSVEETVRNMIDLRTKVDES